MRKSARTPERTARMDRLDRTMDLMAADYLSSDRLSMADLSAKMVRAAMDFTGSDCGFAAYVDRPTGSLVVSALSPGGGAPAKAPDHSIVFTKLTGIWARLVKSRKPVMLNSAGSDPALRGIPSGHLPIKKLLAVPCVYNGELAGLIFIANPPADYNSEDITGLSRLASAYAMTIQRKLADDKRKEDEDRCNSILAASNDIIYTASPEGRLTFISPQVKDYGYSPYEMLGRHISEFVHPDDRFAFMEAVKSILKPGATPGRFDCRLKRKDGSYFHAEENGGVVWRDGRPYLMSGIIRDVTEREDMRERLVKNEETLRRIFETATDAIFVKDLKGRYLQVNRACARFLRKPLEKMLGRTDFQIFPRKVAEAIRKTDSQVIRTGNTIFTSEKILSPRDPRVLYASKSPLRDANGAVIGILGIAKDITELKRLESELIKAKAAEAVSKIARPAAHDFNNVLAAINGYAVLIMETLKEGDPARPEIEQILKAVKRALEITVRLQTFGAGAINSSRKSRQRSVLSKRRSSREA